MTLPVLADISINNINVELGLSGTAQIDLSYINNLVLPAQRPATPHIALHNKAYYQNSTAGNCNNGNQGDCNCNCGNIQCSNCTNCNAINCVNCDTQKWLQTNCNCACTYNCNRNETSYDCDCACAC